MKVMLMIFASLVAANAQQAGSEAIAAAIVPASEKTVSEFTGCVQQLVKEVGISATDALKACKQATELAVKASTRVANEAADATKASRPVVVPCGYWCGGYGFGGFGGGYMVVPGVAYSQVAPRALPPPRPLPPPRQVQ